MMDSNAIISDAELTQMYDVARGVRTAHVDPLSHVHALRSVAQYAIVTYLATEQTYRYWVQHYDLGDASPSCIVLESAINEAIADRPGASVVSVAISPWGKWVVCYKVPTE